MIKFLVTGASGFIGQNLVKSLVGKCHSVKALVRKNYHYNFGKDVEVVFGDLNDKDSLERAVKGVDIIVHAAAVINSTKKENFEKVNVGGTRNIIDAAKKEHVKKFIFISTGDVVLNPGGLYGWSKLRGEKILKNSGLVYVILRPYTVYGTDNDHSICDLVKLIRLSYIIPIIGNGKALLQPVYVGDLIRVILKVANPRIKNVIYNIGGPSPISYNDLVDLIAKELNVKRVKLRIPLSLLRICTEVYGRVANTTWSSDRIINLTKDKTTDITKMAKELQIKPQSIEEGIKNCIRLHSIK